MQDAVAVPDVLRTADAHTTDGAGSDALSDVYTATVPPSTSNPVVRIANEAAVVAYTVPTVYVKLVGKLYILLASVAAAPSTRPATPSGDVTRIYTYHVPCGIVTETDAAFDANVPVPHCVRPVVRPAAAP